MKKLSRVKIVNKKRFAAFCAATALVISSAVCAVFIPADNAMASECEYTPVYVGEGDTLWSIVKENYPSDTDIRSKIYDIQSVNGMSTSTIYPGDVIYIPVY